MEVKKMKMICIALGACSVELGLWLVAMDLIGGLKTGMIILVFIPLMGLWFATWKVIVKNENKKT